MSRHRALRPVDAARFGLGVTALVRPRWLLRAAASADGTWPRRVTRVLGARYVVQASAGRWLDERWVPEADVVVDLAHAMSTVGFAHAFPRHRRLALASGVLALVFAAADLTEDVR
jgi:hypothetical protein